VGAIGDRLSGAARSNRWNYREQHSFFAMRIALDNRAASGSQQRPQRRRKRLLIEPSAKVYSLWEHENAYVDSLGTLQTARDFASGRASAGVKAIYPLARLDGVQLAPYAGIYGDYYFTEDNAAAIALAGGIPLASTPLLDGWSARMTGGIGARFGTGAIVAVGGELGGIGSNTKIWTVSAKARVPFTAR
jgi:hypothetical protein